MLADQYPIGSHVTFVEGLTFVVQGYDDVGLLDRLVIKQSGAPNTGDFTEACVPPEFVRVISPQQEAALPVHPRPTRHELLAAVEDRLLSVCKAIPHAGVGHEEIARTILVLAQARAVLLEGV